MFGRSRNGKPATVRLEVERLEDRVVPAKFPLSSLPALSSLPGAKATLYLDFNGHFQSKWGPYKNIKTPAYDVDGDKTTFNEEELANIEVIWRYVAEDYAPFNINVTTVNPGNFANGVGLRVAIGGGGNWLGAATGGFAFVNSFINNIPNLSFVFAKNLSNGLPRYVAEAASHEAGHAFGLQHQALYSGSTLIEEYYKGPNGERAPIMGSSYEVTRGLWWYGTTTSSTTFQDDMAVLARFTNGFGYRDDDHGNEAEVATPLAINGSQASGSGVITQTDDIDFFGFGTGAGEVSFTVSVPEPYNNLDVVLQLWDAAGENLIAFADPSNSFNATVSAVVAEGYYRLGVASKGGYGDVGAYTVSGNIVPSGNILQGPINLTATGVTAGRIDLSWASNDPNGTSYKVHRSANGVDWELVGEVAGSVTFFQDVNVAPNWTYTYKVDAHTDTLVSNCSNMAQAAFVPTVPLKPTNLAKAGKMPGQINMTWTDNSDNELGFRIERRLVGGKWKVVGTTPPNQTFFGDTSVAPNRKYNYRIRAFNDMGFSPVSNMITVKSLAGGQAGGLPSSLPVQDDTGEGLSEAAVNNFGDIMRAVVRHAETRHAVHIWAQR
jgi:hypothetical protein